MSYCHPDWISTYSYVHMLTRAGTNSLVRPRPVQRTLIVAGSIDGSQLTLEPAFEVTTNPVVPAGGGPYRLEGRRANGATEFAFDFAPVEIADAPAATPRHFVFAIPIANTVTSLHVTGPGIDAIVNARPTGALVAGGDTVSLSRIDGSHVRLHWNPAQYPRLLVRSGVTGEVITFARGGDVTLPTTATSFVVTPSDGVASTDLRFTLP